MSGPFGASPTGNTTGAPKCPRTEAWAGTGGIAESLVAQVMVRGMVACTVVFVLTFFVPLRVVTVSVTWTVTELGPAVSLALGVPESTPALDSFIPLGRLTFFHFKVVT